MRRLGFAFQAQQPLKSHRMPIAVITQTSRAAILIRTAATHRRNIIAAAKIVIANPDFSRWHHCECNPRGTIRPRRCLTQTAIQCA